MLKVKDVTLENFMKSLCGKKIVLVGAGRKLNAFINRYNIENNVLAIVDSNIDLQGKKVKVGRKEITISGVDFFETVPKDITIVITVFFSVMSVLEMLDKLETIDGIECYIVPLLEENFEDENVVYTIGSQQIEKKIHYCWFGKGKIPEQLQRCMESWKRYMPDYEIIRWDESNYDIKKNRYMQEAYDAQKYGFVPDYARLDILYNYGGIYLDTDVEVIKSFDDMLSDQAFMGFGDINGVALGLGFGCVKNNELIKLMMDEYENKSFYDNEGKMNLTTCIEYQYPVLIKYGFKMDNTQQCINGNMIYPVQLFNPESKIGIHKHYTKHTHSIHRGELSYESKSTKDDYKKTLMYLPQRIFQDKIGT